MSRSLLTAAATTAVLAIAVGGCGSSSKKTSSTASSSSSSSSGAPAATTPSSSGSGGTAAGGSSALSVSADPSGALKFSKTTLSAKAGTVTLKMTNPSPTTHGIGVTGNGVDKDGQTVSTGGTSTVTVSLKPGTYTFYCPVPGHRQAGMEGTLTVK